MTDSVQQERFLNLLRQASAEFAAGQTAGALGALLDVREHGFVNKELDGIIEQLRGDAPLHLVLEAADWVDEMLMRLQDFQGDAGRLLEELSEPVLGAAPQAWGPLDEDAVFDDSLLSMEISSFDDFGDLEGFDVMDALDVLEDLDVPGFSEEAAPPGFDLWEVDAPAPGDAPVEVVESLDVFDGAAGNLEQAHALDVFDELDEPDAFVVADAVADEGAAASVAAPPADDVADVGADVDVDVDFDAGADVGADADDELAVDAEGDVDVDDDFDAEGDVDVDAARSGDETIIPASFFSAVPPEPVQDEAPHAWAGADASLRETTLNPSIPLWAAHQQTIRTSQLPSAGQSPSAEGPARDAAASRPAAREAEDEDDFDFDLGLSTPGTALSDLSEQAAFSSQPQAAADFDFDLDFGLDDLSAQTPADAPEDPAPQTATGGLAGQSSHVDTDSGRWGKGFDFGLDDDDSFARPDGAAVGAEPVEPQGRASFAHRASHEARRLDATPVGMPAVSSQAGWGADGAAGHKTARTPSAAQAKGHAAPRVEPALDDDEFFELAESLSGQSPVPELLPQRAPQRYRGEPLMGRQRQATPLAQVPLVEAVGLAAAPSRAREDTPNPFAHEQATGVNNPLVHTDSSFVLEEIRASEVEEEPRAGDVMLQEARRFYENGEFQTARDLLLALIAREPSDAQAAALLATVENELERSLRTRLGSMMKAPRLCVPMAKIASMNLDHRFGYLLSQIDGMITFEDILELSSMSRLETLDVLAQMLARQIISLD